MNEKPKIRVAAYIRVSTEEQAKEGYGLEAQLRNIKSCVEAHKEQGWVWDDAMVYRDEGFSGALMSRPALNKLLEDAKKKKFDLVVVWKIDRFFRNMFYLLNMMEELGRHDVAFKSVTEPFDTTAAGKFVFQMFGALAELERNMILTRTMEGKISSAKAGNYVGGGVPFGYQAIEQKLVLDEDEARVVRNVFAWFVDMDYTIEKIASLLNQRGIFTKADKNKMSKRKVNPSAFWHSATVRKMLQNEKYIGRYYYNRRGKNKDGGQYEKPKSEWVGFACPSIIDETTFNKAKAKMDENKKRSNSAKNLYLLSTKIICGDCGAVFTGYTSMKETKNYRCGRNSKTKAAVPCKASNISEKQIGDAVWDKVKVFLEFPDAELKRIQIEMEKDSYYQTLVNDKKVLDDRSNENRDARQRVKEAYKRRIYTADELEEELASLDKEYEDLKEEIGAINAQLTSQEGKKEKILSIQEMKKKYEGNLASLVYEDKYKVLQALVKRVVMKGDDIKLELLIPKKVQEEVAKSKNVYGVTEWT